MLWFRFQHEHRKGSSTLHHLSTKLIALTDSLRCRPSRLFVRGIISISIWSRLKPNSMSHTMRNRSGSIFPFDKRCCQSIKVCKTGANPCAVFRCSSRPWIQNVRIGRVKLYPSTRQPQTDFGQDQQICVQWRSRDY